MKKVSIAILFTFLSCASQSQEYPHALYSNHYYAPAKNGADGEVLIKKNIYIIYNRDYCTFYVDGNGSVFFRIRGYQTSMQGGYIHTDFFNEENNIIPDGRYGIMIDEGKDGISFQVSLPGHPGEEYPNGYTYFVQKATRYSIDGEVPPIKIDWKAMQVAQRKADSLTTAWKSREIKNRDSVLAERNKDTQFRDSLLTVARQMKIITGDDPPTGWLISVIETRKADSIRQGTKNRYHDSLTNAALQYGLIKKSDTRLSDVWLKESIDGWKADSARRGSHR